MCEILIIEKFFVKKICPLVTRTEQSLLLLDFLTNQLIDDIFHILVRPFYRPYKFLVNFTIPVPRNLDEQKKIVACLKEISSETKCLETIYQRKLANLEELKKSVLKKAFDGELTESCYERS